VSAIGTVEACVRAGLSYRQLDYWVRTGAVTPSLAQARGSGTRRRWSAHDVRRLRAIGQLTGDLHALGVSTGTELVERVWEGLGEQANLVIRQGTVVVSLGLMDPPAPCAHPRAQRVYAERSPERCGRCGQEVA